MFTAVLGAKRYTWFKQMQKQKSYSGLIGVVIHILVWTVFGFAFFSHQPLFSGTTVTLGLLITAFYFNAYILVPRFLLKDRITHYIVIVIGIISAITLINIWAERFFDHFHFTKISFYELFQPNRSDPNILFGFRDIFTIIISGLVVGISTAITTIQKWQKDNKAREAMEKEKVTSELSFLKAQINPHFFFNTLNNIYALTVIDAAIAGKAIHQLSRMMRYLLYDTSQGNTMLSQEIVFIKDYISLMQLRMTDMVKICLDTPGNLQDMPIASMIFLPFVENAFKHGVSTTQQSHISIIISQKDNMLELTVKNPVMKHNNVSLDTSSGIGLVNTRRRLELLYPGKYKLNINERGTLNEFIVHLTLDLS